MGQTPDFDLNVSHNGAMDIVSVRGEIDLVTAPLFRDAFTGLGSRVVVDLREVRFMDSSGLADLIEQKTQTNGGQLRIVADSPPVLRLFELSGLTDLLDPGPDLVLPSRKTKPKTKAS
jgi:anti-anti-sigma factor